MPRLGSSARAVVERSTPNGEEHPAASAQVGAGGGYCCGDAGGLGPGKRQGWSFLGDVQKPPACL